MKGFWKRKLPAFLLAVVMLVGLTPAALADEPGETPTEHTHSWSETWSRSSTQHWHECSGCSEKGDPADHDFKQISRTEPSCFEDGKAVYECSECGYKKEETLSATSDHDYSTVWSGDNDQHWHACVNAGAGCTAKADTEDHRPADEGVVTDPTCTTDGKITYTCAVCGRTYTRPGTTALGHSLDSTGKCTRPGCGYQETTSYTVTFKTGSETISESVRVGNSASMSKVPAKPTYSATNKTYTFKGWIEGTTTTYVYTGQTLVTPTSTPITKDTTFSAVYTVSATKQDVSLDVSASTSGSKVGTALRTALNDAYKKVTGDSFSTVKFTSISSSTYGKLYTSSTKNSAVASSTAYDYSEVANFYFVPTSQKTFTMTYTAAAGTNTVTGTVTFAVGGSSSASGTTIKLSVDAGDEVVFPKTKFKEAYEAKLDGTIRYVTFSTTATLSTSTGTVYYNYGLSGQKSFTRTTIDDYDFYYSSSSYGDYALGSLSYVAPEDADSATIKLTYKAYDSAGDYVSGTLQIDVAGGSSSSATGTTIKLAVDAGDEVVFPRTKFKEAYDSELDGTVRYVTFSTSATLSTSEGTVYYNYGLSGQKSFTKSTIDDYDFYYSSSSYGDYALANLSYVAPKGAASRTVKLTYRVYDSAGDYVTGTLEIKVGSGSSASGGDITYEVAPGGTVAFDRDDFNEIYQEEYTGTIRYVTFSTSDTLSTTTGTVYFDYEGSKQKSFTKSTIDDFAFYYSSSSYGDYALNSLTFVAGKSFSTAIELEFTAYYSSTKYVEGTLVIKPKGATVTTANKGDIFYYTAYTDNVQINANDIARHLKKVYPDAGLQYVRLDGVPATGSLYYNYYGASKYGSGKLKLTASNCTDQNFYFSPSLSTQYALSELTYVPSGSNYCAAIPFTAYASSARSVSGTILISVNLSTVPDVYGVTTKGATVSMPSTAIYSAIAKATGVQLGGIQLLKLPSATAGTLYVGSGTATKANTTTQYGYSSGTYQMSQLRFVPASGFTGSVEIPYLAYNTGGKVIASGRFCLGVVNSVRKFSDMSNSTWCYKYVIELNDAGVIAGYKDGTFQEKRNVTYGEALKLIMLAAGYKEQAPTGKHWASGYLTKARADKLITGTVDLNAPITRLAVAQIAAKAMKLSTSNLSSIKPFTDTSDVYVQALNAAGIVEGYFSNGTSTYKGGNNLTRGHISAIVWRMERYQG